jgi:hypothetical protein
MKKFLLGAAAALAFAAPGVASAQSGYVDLGYASAEGEVLGVDTEGDGWQLGGAAAWTNFQLDGVFSNSDDTSSYLLGGHLFARNESHLFGGFANYGSVDPDGGVDYDAWTLGLEGQWYADRTTFDGVLSYSDAEDLDTTFTALDLGATHFVSDNFSFGGKVGFGQLDIAGTDVDTLSYGIGAEWQFASAPISIFGGWDHLSLDDIDTEQDTLSVGVRYSWGGSLFERNRSGASLRRNNGLASLAGAF